MIKPGHQINISGNPEQSDGVYSNLVLIAFSRAEFVIDFARIMPGTPTGRLKSRVIMSPIKIKGLISALEKQIKLFEDKYGKLEEIDTPGSIGFQNPENNIDESV